VFVSAVQSILILRKYRQQCELAPSHSTTGACRSHCIA